MFVWIKRGFLSLAILGLLFTGAAQAQNGQGRGNGAGASGDVVQLRPAGPVPGQYIVVFEDDVTDPRGLANALARAHGIAPRHVYESALKGFAARMPAPIAEMLALDPDVAYVEQDVYAQTQFHGNSFQTLPVGVDRIDADLNYTADINDTDDARVNVDIAIIDTGIDLDHPDLNVVFDRNFNNSSKSGDDDNGHGTHVAGSAAALDNGIGLVGVAPGARLWALKVLNKRGSGSFADVIAAIDFVTLNAGEIEVVNMSLGGTGRLNSLRTAIQDSVAKGVVYVVAAGNNSRDVYGNDGTFDTSDDFIPAAYPEVAAISAMGDTDGQAGGLGPDTSYGTGDDTFADFTNFSGSVTSDNPVTSSGAAIDSSGAAIDLAAPGVDVWSTYKDGMYAQMSGTSMASPHVAGAAALYIAENYIAFSDQPNSATDVADIRQALIAAAEAQSLWRLGQVDTATNDPDSNLERLVNVAGGPANDTPVVSITSPADGGEPIVSGTTIDFIGSANDTEDGNLTTSLTWTSDLVVGSIGTGGSFSTTLIDGTHTITATVDDSEEKAGTASITVTVGIPNQAPTVSIDSPADSTAFNTGAIIDFGGSASDPEDGHLTAGLAWTANGVSIGSGGSFQAVLGDGSYTIMAEVIDSDGDTDSASISITVGNAPAEVGVVGITFGRHGGRGGTKHLLITVALDDDLGNPVEGASVTLQVSGPKSGTGTGTTLANGTVAFSLKNAPSCTTDLYTATVTNVTAAGLNWVPSDPTDLINNESGC